MVSGPRPVKAKGRSLNPGKNENIFLREQRGANNLSVAENSWEEWIVMGSIRLRLQDVVEGGFSKVGFGTFFLPAFC